MSIHRILAEPRFEVKDLGIFESAKLHFSDVAPPVWAPAQWKHTSLKPMKGEASRPWSQPQPGEHISETAEV